MDNETTISQGLHIADESARYDAACKRLLSEKQILARIMKECIVEQAMDMLRVPVAERQKYVELLNKQ